MACYIWKLFVNLDNFIVRITSYNVCYTKLLRIEAGMNPQALKNILGHQNLSITMDLYSKVQDKMREAEMDKLNDIFKISYT